MAPFAAHIFDHLLVVKEENLDLFGLVTRLLVKLVVSGTLAHFVHPVNIDVHVLAVPLPDLNHSVKKLLLQFNGLSDV